MTEKLQNQSLAVIMDRIEKIINQNPAPIKGFNAVFQFEIKDEENGTYQLHIQDEQVTITQQQNSAVDCTLQLLLENFRKFLAGELKGTVAFMTGKLKIQGDMTKALKLESLVKAYRFF